MNVLTVRRIRAFIKFHITSITITIHTLFNIYFHLSNIYFQQRILTNEIVRAVGAEAASLGHWWDITISATRHIIMPIHFLIDYYYCTCWNFDILDYFSRFIHVTLRYTQNFIYVAYYLISLVVLKS